MPLADKQSVAAFHSSTFLFLCQVRVTWPYGSEQSFLIHKRQQRHTCRVQQAAGEQAASEQDKVQQNVARKSDGS